MTVSSSASRNQYTATAGQTVFAYTFEIVSDDDIVVLKNGVTLTKTADYTVSGVGVDSGGNVTLVVGATAGDILTLYRDMAYERLTDYTNAGDFLAADVNNDFDRLWIATQQVNEEVNRSIKAPVTDPLTIDMTLPAKASRVGKLLRFNATTGDPEAVSESDVFTSGSLNVYNFTGDGSDTTFSLGQDPGGENNTQVYIDGVYQQKNTYSVTGTVITFSAAPPNLSTIEVMVVKPIAIGATSASSVSFTQAGSSTERNVQLKLQESVSVKDFGAIGDGVTDDTAAIQAAIDSGTKTIFFPRGIYFVGTQLTVGSASPLAQFVGDGYLSSEIKCAVSGVNIFLERANVEFFGLRFIPAPSAVNPIAVKSALPTNFADCDVWFRECWLDTGIYIAHQVVGRGSQFDSCILKCTTVMEITAPNPYNYSGSSASQPPEAGMRRYRVTDCDIDGVDTLIKAPNNTTADKYIHNVVVSGNSSNGLDFLFRGQSLRDSSIVNNVILVTENGTLIESLIAAKYISNVTISGNYFAGWSNPTVTITGRWNALISATNDPFDFSDTTVLNETLVDNLTIVGNVIKDIKLVVLNSYGNIKRIIATGNTFKRLFETSTTSPTMYLFNSRNYSDLTFAHNTISSDTGLITATQFYLANGTAGSNGNEFLFSNDSSFTLSSEKPTWTTGSGTPEGAVTAVVGSMYTRTDGGAGTSFYIKESGTSNTGWVAK